MHFILGRTAASLLAAALMLSAACATSPPIEDPFRGGAQARQEGIQIQVENQNFSDASVHALRGGERVRLGQVGGKSDEQFALRWTFSLDLEFEIDLIGGGTCRSDPMNVDPGDRVWVRIPTQLFTSQCLTGKR